jgi:hypothetical protein
LSCFSVCSGEFDNAGAMMSVDDTLMCSFQILKPAEKKGNRFTPQGAPGAGGAVGGMMGGMSTPMMMQQQQQVQQLNNSNRPATPPRNGVLPPGQPVGAGGVKKIGGK